LYRGPKKGGKQSYKFKAGNLFCGQLFRGEKKRKGIGKRGKKVFTFSL